jgi:hypothetical protein
MMEEATTFKFCCERESEVNYGYDIFTFQVQYCKLTEGLRIIHGSLNGIFHMLYVAMTHNKQMDMLRNIENINWLVMHTQTGQG